MVALSHWLLQTATQVMLCVRHHIQWDVPRCAVQLTFRILTFQSSPTVILLFRPFVTDSGKWRWDNMADKSASPLSCCRTDHCQLCGTLSVIKWGWLILFLVEWDCPFFIYTFYAAKRVYYLLNIIMLFMLLQAILYFHCWYFIKYLKPGELFSSAEFVTVCLDLGKASHWWDWNCFTECFLFSV
jgi:hypothetical protein